jgi:hypothetical protein
MKLDRVQDHHPGNAFATKQVCAITNRFTRFSPIGGRRSSWTRCAASTAATTPSRSRPPSLTPCDSPPRVTSRSAAGGALLHVSQTLAFQPRASGAGGSMRTAGGLSAAHRRGFGHARVRARRRLPRAARSPRSLWSVAARLRDALPGSPASRQGTCGRHPPPSVVVVYVSISVSINNVCYRRSKL